jgi:nucleoside 2-deoxyribosyltransferase
MQIAYIAGPYRAKTKLGIIRNILKARKIAKKYWRKGYAVFCPHLNSALMDGTAPDEVFLKGDLEFLQHADILVVTPGWERSKGTLAEIEFAKEKGIPIQYWGD